MSEDDDKLEKLLREFKANQVSGSEQSRQISLTPAEVELLRSRCDVSSQDTIQQTLDAFEATREKVRRIEKRIADRIATTRSDNEPDDDGPSPA